MSTIDPAGRRRGGLRKLAWILGGVVLLFVVARLVLGAWGGHRLEAAAAAWREDPDFRALTAMTATESNDSALRLQQLAAPLGIDFEPRRPHRGEPPMTTVFPNKDLSAWLWSARAASDGNVAQPPASVTAFLSDHAAEIDALIAHLIHEERPQWTLDLSRGFEAPVPNLSGHMRTMRLLVASAFVDDAAGNAERSHAALEATWKLTASLGLRPELICGLIRMAMLRQLAAALMSVDVPAEPMFGRLAALDMRAVVRRGCAAEALASLEFGRSGRGLGEYMARGDEGVAWAELIVPRRFLAASHVVSLRELVRDLDALDPCTGNPSGLSQARLDALPSWDVLARIMLPNIDSFWSRALQADLELALTRSVLASRQALAAGSPPPDPIQLRCEAWAFREERLPVGGFRLSFEGQVPWTLEANAPRHPLSHVEPGRSPPVP